MRVGTFSYNPTQSAVPAYRLSNNRPTSRPHISVIPFKPSLINLV